jgi:hypothetical protein
MPRVSVVLVFHRVTGHLRPAIDSLLNQTWRDLELVIVDNGCRLDAAARAALAIDPRVRWVALAEDTGIGPAANAGIAAAAGDYIAIADYDDLSLPTRIEREVAALDADPGLALVSAFADRMDGEDRPLGDRVFTLAAPGEFAAYAPYAAPLVHPASMGRRAVYEEFPFRSPFRFTSELDFYARVTERHRLGVIPEVLLRYRWYPSQTTQRHAANIDQSRCVILQLAARRRAGRPEALDRVEWMTDALSAGEFAARVARQCLDEELFVPAAYLARRAFALDRSPAGAWRATALAAALWRRTPRTERAAVAAMFRHGPVRALGVTPA